MQSNNIVLVGFMGTGKSTVGRLLAEKLGWDLIDSDHYIEKQEGMSISELFSRQGEAYFREVESKAIREIMSRSKQVIATGGGAVMVEENRLHMKQNGFVVALTASAETIVQRVGGDRNRPLLKNKPQQVVPELLERRKHAYDFADTQIATDKLRIELIVQRVMELFDRVQ